MHDHRVEIVVSPEKTLYIIPSQSGNAEDAAFIQHFNSREFAPFLLLLKAPEQGLRSPSTRFWFEFAAEILRRFCILKENSDLAGSPDPRVIAQFLAAAPEFQGRSSLDPELLSRWWTQAYSLLEQEYADFGSTFRHFIEASYPDWAQVGRLHFHLAETPEGSAYPFAFLATVVTRVADKSRLQHRALGSVLAESATSHNKELLHSLLLPIRQAAAHNRGIAELLESKRLFTTAYLTSSEAWQFLKGIGACEQAGIVVKLPKSWGGKPPSAVKVAVTLNGPPQESFVGINSLFSFQIAASVGGQNLSPDELSALLACEQDLVAVQGKWIAIDRAHLEPLLEKWQRAQQLQAEGFTFSEAMRLLSGTAITPRDQGLVEDASASRSWVEVTAGTALRTSIANLLRPAGEFSAADQLLLNRELKATLRPYQQVGVTWLQTISRLGLGACLADDMGLGKTLQIISLLLLEKSRVPGAASLVVLPASLLGNWQQELEKFAPSLRFGILHPSAGNNFTPQRYDEVDVVLTTYSLVGRTPWLYEKSWNLLIIDEAQAIKNPGAQQTRHIKKIAARVRIAMTGTPIENRMSDLWSLFDFCCRGLLGSYPEFRTFQQAIEAKGHYEGLRRLISPYILRRKKTDRNVVADLPEKTEVKTYCHLSPAQISLYQATLKELADSLKASEQQDFKRKAMVLSYLLKFKQICNHPSQLQGDGMYNFSESGKFLRLGELVEIIAAQGEKLLVFTQFRELTDIIDGFLAKSFGRRGCVLHGGTPIAKRRGLVDEFQSPAGPPYFVLSLKAGGTGLNLTRASHVLHFDRWWNPAVEDQASDRAFRIGQTKNVMVHKFICRGTIEERIDAMIDSKKLLADQVIEGTSRETALSELSNEELLRLVALDLSTATEEQ
jgi:non-specific serine/threonine protein kinase